MANIKKTQSVNIVKGKIANALTSVAKDHIVATAHDLYDENLEMYQEEINTFVQGGAKEETLVSGIERLSNENDEIKTEVGKTAKQQTLISGITQTGEKLGEISGKIDNIVIPDDYAKEANATANKNEIIAKIDSSLTPDDYAKESNATSNKNEILAAINALAERIEITEPIPDEEILALGNN